MEEIQTLASGDSERSEALSQLMAKASRLPMTDLKAHIAEIDSTLLEQEPPVKACPYCESANIVRNGHKHGKQAYLCRCCGRSFVSTTGTVRYWSHQSASTWIDAIAYTLDGATLKKLEETLGISHGVAFSMRHKILRGMEIEAKLENPVAEAGSVQDSPALQDASETVASSEPTGVPDFSNVTETRETAEASVAAQSTQAEVSNPQTNQDEQVPQGDTPSVGSPVMQTNEVDLLDPSTEGSGSDIIEVGSYTPPSHYDPTSRGTAPVKEFDETFVLESYKGSKLPSDFWREPRKHGAKAQKSGISNEYICICASVQREGGAFARSVNRAVPSVEELGKAYASQLTPGTMVMCDGRLGYDAICMNAGCVAKNVNTVPKEDKPLFNINKVNNFHSMIKEWLRRYRGVATKYLNRYNALFSVAYKLTREGTRDITRRLLTVSSTSRKTTYKAIKEVGLLAI